ncbi:MAG: aminoacyl-tRNA hydrolase [Dongiaceae bacterium]
MLLLVGLGNPGPGHAGNRHNVGFMALEAIARRHRFAAARARFHALTAEGEVGGEKIIALEPTTYMNDSGRAVEAAAHFYKLAPERVIVIHDEIDLDPGRMKVKRGGGAGGHNGLRSIDAHLGNDYWRVRLGVGHPGHKDLVKHFVLHDFHKDERALIDKQLDAVAEAFPLLAAGDPNGFMSKVDILMKPPRPPRQRQQDGETPPPPPTGRPAGRAE